MYCFIPIERESTTRDTFSIPNEEVKVEEKEKFKGSDNVHIVKYKHLKYLSKDFPLNPKEEKKNCYLMIFFKDCLLYTSPSPRDRQKSRMPSSA